MLVLSRKKNQTIHIGGNVITIRVLDIRGDKVRLGIEAPLNVPVFRGEIQEAIDAGNDTRKRTTEGVTDERPTQ